MEEILAVFNRIGYGHETLNPKHEMLNKYESPKFKIPNSWRAPNVRTDPLEHLKI